MMLDMTCECGYDYLQPTGHPDDRATCRRCAWTSTGIQADHNAYHHHLTTLHEWHLQMGRPPWQNR